MDIRLAVDHKKRYDVIVVGGGISGFSAAVGAARKGLHTALIEREGMLGGAITRSLVSHFLGGVKYDEDKGEYSYNVKGICKELCDRLLDVGKAIDFNTIDRNMNPHGWIKPLCDGVPFVPEDCARIMDQMAIEAGAEIYFQTEYIKAVKRDDSINCVIVHNKSGLLALYSDVFIDATGDADVAYDAGAQTVLGRDTDNLCTPVSLEMQLERVDTAEIKRFITPMGRDRFRVLIKELREKGVWTFPYDQFICVQLIPEDVYFVNTIRQVGINGVNGKDISRGLIEGRRECEQLFKILKAHFPGFSNARVKQIASMLGIRETRRIKGIETLLVEDIIHGSIPPTSIAVSAYGWDLPDPERPNLQPMRESGVKKSAYTNIPYGVMVPRGIKNLLVAGRCISCERDALGVVRVMAPCSAMGQAAGTAAAVYIKTKTDSFANLDVIKLQNALVDDGAIIAATIRDKRRLTNFDAFNAV